MVPACRARPYAETTQALIDREVSRLLREAEQNATGLLRDHVAELDQLADLLIDRETVGGEEVYRLLGLTPPDRIEDAPTVAPHLVPAEHRAADHQGAAPPREKHTTD